MLATLTPKQKRIVALLAEGCTQGIVHDRLHLSRSFISQTVTSLEKHSLLKRKSSSKYNAFYELSPALKNQISENPLPKLTTCRVHNIRRKYTVLSISREISTDQRAGFMGSWKPKGSTRYKFWYSGKAGEPSITIDLHPKKDGGATIVAYPDAGQEVLAETIDEVEDKTNIIIHNAVLKFIAEQQKFNVHMQVEGVGKTITDPHYGFAISKGTAHADAGTTLAGWDVDASPQDLGNPEQVELETKKKWAATPLDSLIKSADALPEALKELGKIGTLTSEVHTVLAHIQSGQPIQNQVNQLIIMFGEMLKNQHEILKRMDGK